METPRTHSRPVHMVVLLCIVLTLTGCGRSPKPQAQEGKGAREAATGKLVIIGSTALQPLVEEAAHAFKAENPEAEITVQGGGSGTGLSQVAAGSANIGMSDIAPEDKPELKAADLVDHKVAIVGIAVVTHPKITIKNLSHQQLIDVFTGTITNWDKVGAKSQKIVVVNRPKGSGTRTVFEKQALGGANALETIVQDSSGTVRKIVADTPGAIGYLAFSYVNNTVQAISIDGVSPIEAHIRDGTYSIWSYEHMVTKSEPVGLTKSFLDYMLSSAVQDKLVTRLGYIPVKAVGSSQ